MNGTIANILDLFSGDYHEDNHSESCDTYKIVYSIGTVKRPDTALLQNFIDQIPARDDLFISFSDQNVDYKRSEGSDLNAFLDHVERAVCNHANQKFKLAITKNIESGIRSVYDDAWFLDFMQSRPFPYFLSILSQRIHENRLVFEYQDKEIPTTYSSSICFKTANSEEKFWPLDNKTRELRLSKSRELCHWYKENVNITPDDLYFKQDGEGAFNLRKLLDKSCLAFTWMHVADYVEFKTDGVTFNLNGLRSYSCDIPNEGIVAQPYDTESVRAMVDIFQWCYSEGNFMDKMMIVRNILSVNLRQDTLSIPANTFNSVLSNFKIFQKENVERYLKMRNDLSDKLIGLQCEINKLADDYLSEYKKNIVAFLSFVVPMIVVRAMTNGEMIDVFSPSILIVMLASAGVSYIYFLYTQGEYQSREKMMKRQFAQMKERYREVLSEEERNFIFADSNEQDQESYTSFLRTREESISKIWKRTLVVIVWVTILIFVLLLLK